MRTPHLPIEDYCRQYELNSLDYADPVRRSLMRRRKRLPKSSGSNGRHCHWLVCKGEQMGRRAIWGGTLIPQLTPRTVPPPYAVSRGWNPGDRGNARWISYDNEIRGEDLYVTRGNREDEGGYCKASVRLIDHVLLPKAPDSVHFRGVEQAISGVRPTDPGVFVPGDTESNQGAVTIRSEPP